LVHGLCKSNQLNVFRSGFFISVSSCVVDCGCSGSSGRFSSIEAGGIWSGDVSGHRGHFVPATAYEIADPKETSVLFRSFGIPKRLWHCKPTQTWFFAGWGSRLHYSFTVILYALYSNGPGRLYGGLGMPRWLSRVMEGSK